MAAGRTSVDQVAQPGPPASLGVQLLDWFDQHQRVLPWRQERTPYRVWVSEIMLQQTQVDTVIPYFEAFVADFPSVEALAAADQADVLKRWEGLGYYNRARLLHRAARHIAAHHGGRLPSDVGQLRTLPGIGPYTAGAIASIAFGQPVPAVDGNVLRVITRLRGIEDEMRTAAARRRVEAEVVRLMVPRRAGMFNEALMELGALVCLPRNPQCHRCPWQAECVALRQGKVDELPRRAARRPPPVVYGVVAVLVKGGKVLVRQRPEGGLLAGLWEFPWTEIPALSDEAALPEVGPERWLKPDVSRSGLQALKRMLAAWGLAGRVLRQLPRVTHIFSHLQWKLDVFELELKDGTTRGTGLPADMCWVEEDGLAELPFGRAHRRIADSWRLQKTS